MKLIIRALMLLALSQLTACAVMSKKECLTANWHKVGYDVAMQGYSNTQKEFDLRERTCAKHGAIALWKPFEGGHANGTDVYCQLENAVSLGVDGKKRVIDNDVCPESRYPGFQSAFDEGYELYGLRIAVDGSEMNISYVSKKLSRCERRIVEIDTLLNDDAELDSRQRNELKGERSGLLDDVDDLEREREFYYEALSKKEDKFSEYESYLFDEYLSELRGRVGKEETKSDIYN